MTGRTITRADLAASLQRRIVSGELAPGDRLPSERSLVTQHGVGRSSVREAIRELAERGLVEIVPGRGTFVARPSVRGIAGGVQRWAQRRGVTPHEVIDARELIEIEAGRSAASASLGANEILICSILDRLEEETDPIHAAHLDMGFHLCFARASGNPVLELLLGSLAPMTTQLVLLSQKFTLTERDKEHRAIMDAVAQQDRHAAMEAIRIHHQTARVLFAETYDLQVVGHDGTDVTGDLDELLERHNLPAWTWE
ncbi:MAG: transcriptional regulator NanR [Acidimicrobiia bacterium]|nr:MAG: transcriptional regulator NanR [Acidimicrobiia bacterium]